MRINTNVAALNSYNQLNKTNGNLSKSLERLSSGKRINSAADDAAGLAISEKMGSQTRGLGQAQRNAQDGISMIQTAEGALKESHSILQRMRELSVQASNDTNTDDDRAEIQKEVDQLTSELDRISSDTEFNTQKLLNGEKEASAEIDGTAATNVGDIELTNESLESGDYELTVTSASKTVESLEADNSGLTGSEISLSGVNAGEYQIEVGANNGESGNTVALRLLDGEGNEIDTQTGTIATGGSGVITGATSFVVDGNTGAITLNDGTDVSTSGGVASFEVQVKADMTVTDADGNEVASVSGATANEDSSIEVDGFGTVDVAGDLADETDTVEVTNNGATLHIGANEGQSTVAAMNDMSSEALKVDDVDLTTQEGADAAIATIDDAISNVSAERSKLGAIQNRLDHTINNLNTSEENLTAAESRISDVDMAKEMMNMSKQQILSQAGNAMMAQANQLPQGVLQLLG